MIKLILVAPILVTTSKTGRSEGASTVCPTSSSDSLGLAEVGQEFCNICTLFFVFVSIYTVVYMSWLVLCNIDVFCVLLAFDLDENY